MAECGGPDFICIGMPKSGTGWLFDQLQYHPEFWMPPVKEIDYLIRDVPRLKNVRRKNQKAAAGNTIRPRKKPERKVPPRRRPWDERDRDFIDQAMQFRGQPRDIEKYASLFRYKGNLKSGDVSPTYIGLPDDVVSQIAQHLPGTKIILLVRDPVERACSQISMAYNRAKFDPAILDDREKFASFLASSVTTRQDVFPTQIAMRWQCHAPAVEFRVFLFDEIANDPRSARQHILEYLGASESDNGTLPPEYNRKSRSPKLMLPDAAKKTLVGYFAEEIRACGAMFGGFAQQWAPRYGL